MRYLLDTCIMLYMLNKTGEMSDDVEAAAKHTDTSDHLIIAHAITEHLPLISSDGKFDFYCKQGLNFIFNKKK